MEKHTEFNSISPELLAAFLDGNASAAESFEVLQAIGEDDELREIIRIAQEVDNELGLSSFEMEILPLNAMAASCGEENCCSLECEKYILSKRGISFDEREMLHKSLKNKWLNDEGTALHNIGRHLEENNLNVERKFHCEFTDIVMSLTSGADLIAVVDGGELIANAEDEQSEDMYIGQIPDHTVVILSCDIHARKISVYDPNSPNQSDTYSFAQFSDAWADSKNYLVTVAPKTE